MYGAPEGEGRVTPQMGDSGPVRLAAIQTASRTVQHIELHRIAVGVTDCPAVHAQVHNRGVDVKLGHKGFGDIGRAHHTQMNHQLIVSLPVHADKVRDGSAVHRCAGVPIRNEQAGQRELRGRRGSSAIASWVAAHVKKGTVGGQTVYDLTQPLSAAS